METYEDPYIWKAIVNGLIATAILWGFWTPFILIIVIRLVNAQIKDGVCEGASYVGLNYQYNYIYQIANFLHENFGLDWDTLYALRTPFNDEADKNIIKNDPNVLSDDNKNLSILMIIACIVVISVSIGLAVFLVYKYNLNGWSIIAFNLVMAVIIMGIEAAFFGGVATQYIPFYPPSILQRLSDQIVAYIENTV